MSAKKDTYDAKKDNFSYSVVLEDHLLNLKNPLKVYRNWKNPEQTSVLHFHHSIEIGYCHKGTGVNIVANHIVPFSAGDFCIIPKGVSHWQLSNRNIESIWTYIFIDPIIFTSRLSSYTEQLSLNLKNLIVFEEKAAHYFKDFYFTLIEEYEQKRFGYAEIIEAQIFILLMKVLQLESVSHKINQNTKLTSNGMQRLLPALNHIRINFQMNMQNYELAEKCNMSLRNFTRLFKTVMETTSKAYILQIRISMSCFDLKNTSLSITTIAYKNGFQNISHFERAFKRLKRVSPISFRNST